MKGDLFIYIVLLFFVCLCLEICPTSSVNATSDSPTPTPSPSAAEVCARYTNKTCEKCLKAAGAKCFWCNTDKKCALYPKKDILPTKYCSLSQARWGVCFLNFEALIISMSVIAGVLIIGFCLCIYCCCCRSRSHKAKYAKEDAACEHKKAERKMHHDQKHDKEDREYAQKKAERQVLRGHKKADRKVKNDEIRRKYGLMPDDDSSYHRFEETA